MAVNVNISKWISEHHKQLLANDPETWENASVVLVMAQIERIKKSDDYYKKYDNAELDDLIDDAFRDWKEQFWNDDYAPAQKASFFGQICKNKLRDYHRAKTILDKESGDRMPREREIDYEEMVNKEIPGTNENVSSQRIHEDCNNIISEYCKTKMIDNILRMLEIAESGDREFSAVCHCILKCLEEKEYLAKKQKETKRRNAKIRVKRIVKECAQYDQNLNTDSFHMMREDCLETFFEVYGVEGFQKEINYFKQLIDKRYISLR